MVRRLRERGVDVVEQGGGRADDTDEAVDGVLAHPEVTALMTPSDIYALGVIESLQRRGRTVPDQMSVTGYDGIGVLRTPVIGLTTWVQPITRIGFRAVDAVVAQLDGPAPPAHHQALHGELLVGRTAGPPPSSLTGEPHPSVPAARDVAPGIR
jgi:DNA-binding LacI/PurR family transcriptional regulator